MSKDTSSGWKNYYQVAHSDYLRCGLMECVRCKLPIVGYYLIRERKNFLHRGNETEQQFLFHRGCNPSHPMWKEFDKLQELNEKTKVERDKVLDGLHRTINEWGFSQDELFG